MRVSIHKSESQIWPVHDLQVRFNGLNKEYVISADTDGGFIDCYVMGTDGTFLLNETGDEVLVVTLYGEVEIIANGEGRK